MRVSSQYLIVSSGGSGCIFGIWSEGLCPARRVQLCLLAFLTLPQGSQDLKNPQWYGYITLLMGFGNGEFLKTDSGISQVETFLFEHAVCRDK